MYTTDVMATLKKIRKSSSPISGNHFDNMMVLSIVYFWGTYNKRGNMLKFKYISNYNQLLYEISIEDVTDFLYQNLDKFRDTKKAIRKALDYALSEESGKGGFILLARYEDELVGCVVVNKTGMSEYIPENILVYAAVRSDLRGKGFGTEIIRASLNRAEGPVALHVEYDNPAKRLYERLGFTTKYAEMRYTPGEIYHDNP